LSAIVFFTRNRGQGPLLQDGEHINDVENTGQRQSRSPDCHPVVLAAHAGDNKTDANKKAERGKGQEGTLTASDLVGRHLITGGETVWVDGPLALPRQRQSLNVMRKRRITQQ